MYYIQQDEYYEADNNVKCNFKFKIGMNATENKLQHISKQILLEKLNFNFVHYKGHMKIQFLKFGKT